jgi:hypothetical protein
VQYGLNQTTKDWHTRGVSLRETTGLAESFFAEFILRPETCMMDAELNSKCSCTMVAEYIRKPGGTTMHGATFIPRDYESFAGLDVDKRSMAVTFTDHAQVSRSISMPHQADHLVN